MKESKNFGRDLISLTFLSMVFAVFAKTHSQSCSIQMKQVEIICNEILNYVTFDDDRTHLTCEVDRSMRSPFSDSSVSSVVHSNKSEVKNLAEIIRLEILSDEVKFIPSGIGSYFTNLKILEIRSGLLSVNKENFKELGSSLEELYIQFNKLIYIDADLFEYNPNMMVIYLRQNPFRYIEPEFFTNLKKFKNLKMVYLLYSGCMSESFYADDNITTYNWNYRRCNDTTAKLEIQLLISNSKCSAAAAQIIEDKTSIINKNYNSTSSSNKGGSSVLLWYLHLFITCLPF